MLLSLFHQNMKDYLKSCKFLPKLNNERPDERNPDYKKRFTRLQNLVLIMVTTSDLSICLITVILKGQFMPLYTTRAYHQHSSTQTNTLIWVCMCVLYFYPLGSTEWKRDRNKAQRKLVVWILRQWENKNSIEASRGAIFILLQAI